jgi:hypothetical protein
MPFWLQGKAWRAEEATVREYYPEAQWHEGVVGQSVIRRWRFLMDPIPEPEQLRLVSHDLDADAQVAVGLRGRLAHSGNCEVDPAEHGAFDHIRLAPQIFLVEYEYPSRPGADAGPIHPKARILRPAVTNKSHPSHPHLYFSPSGDAWACPVSPHHREWDWSDGTLRYLDFLSIWLLKTAIWLATGGGVVSTARWPGSATSHGAYDLVADCAGSGPCSCGSGKFFSDCHQAPTRDALFRDLQVPGKR